MKRNCEGRRKRSGWEWKITGRKCPWERTWKRLWRWKNHRRVRWREPGRPLQQLTERARERMRSDQKKKNKRNWNLKEWMMTCREEGSDYQVRELRWRMPWKNWRRRGEKGEGGESNIYRSLWDSLRHGHRDTASLVLCCLANKKLSFIFKN